MTELNQQLRRQMIAEAAYFRAQQRGFEGGDTVSDWLEAEAEIDRTIGHGRTRPSLEERLAATNERLRAFRKRLSQMASGAHGEWEDDVKKLAKYRDRLRKRINEAREQTGHAADRAKAKAEETWEEISAQVERLSRRKNGHS